MDKPAKWRGKSYGGRFGHLSFLFLMRAFGLSPCYALLAFVAFYFAFFKRGVYRESAAYIRRAISPHPLATPLHVYRHVYNFGKTLIDKWAFYCGTGNIEIDNSEGEKIAGLAARGSGLVAVNAHFGAWEISASLLKDTCGRDTFVLGLNTEDGEISEILEENRVREKVGTLETDKLSVFQAYALLKGGDVIAMQSDRLMDGGRSEPASFMGAQIRIPSSAFSLARHAGAPLVQVHCVRISSRKYKVFVFPLDAATERVAAQSYAANLENLARLHPYQWANFYDFFGDQSRP